MFIQNKYTRWYYQIISVAQLRGVAEGVYVESHHIIPKSLGGTDGKNNLVLLTAREHFICHWLLTKMTLGHCRSKMVFALSGMRRQGKLQNRYFTKITSRVFAKAKEEAAILSKAQNSGRALSEEHKKNISLSLKGKPKSEEWKQANRKPKSSKAGYQQCQKGKVVSEETKQKLRGPKTEEHKQKLRARVITDEWRAKLSAAAKANAAARRGLPK